MPITFGLAMCRDHAEATVPADLMDERGRGVIADIIKKRMGLRSPDLDRAEIELRRLGDKPWVAFQRANAQMEGGGTA